MLTKDQQALWEKLEHTLNREQLLWLSGYAQGKAGGHAGATTETAGNRGKLHIFFATETGNSKLVAQQLLKPAKAAGWKAAAKPVTRVALEELAALDGPAVFVLATHGEGDPPETAVHFYEAIKAGGAGALASLSFITLGLGDKSYAEFCGFARKVDAEFERLGGKALIERTELDVDFASHITGWLERVIKALPGQENAPGGVSFEMHAPVIRMGKGYNRLEPVTGIITDIVNLNDTDSNKETYHLEIQFTDEIHYEPGDAAGIVLPDDIANGDVTPRLYSIASSQQAHGNSLHLTVAHAWHEQGDGTRGFGLCSHYLADLKPGDKIQFFIQQNHLFKLPADDRDVIMIGPGTGIAPFRSFVWERSERGADGRNWLVFGDQHAHCDFLYQLEWQDHLQSGALHRIDLAFSRDQDRKVYVQHRLKEHADELLDWIENGAHLYVCGAKEPMSKDVEATLLELITTRKGAGASDYLTDLAEAGRYVKDVY